MDFNISRLWKSALYLSLVKDLKEEWYAYINEQKCNGENHTMRDIEVAKCRAKIKADVVGDKWTWEYNQCWLGWFVSMNK